MTYANPKWIDRLHDMIVNQTPITNKDVLDAGAWCHCACSELDDSLKGNRRPLYDLPFGCPTNRGLMHIGIKFSEAFQFEKDPTLAWKLYKCIHKKEAELLGRPDLFEELKKDPRYIKIEAALAKKSKDVG